MIGELFFNFFIFYFSCTCVNVWFFTGRLLLLGAEKKVACIAILNGNLANEVFICTATPPR